MKPIDQLIYETVVARKQELQKIDADSLRSFPEYSDSEFDALGKTQLLATWKHPLAENEDIFVIKCKRYIILGFGHMFAEGFVLDADDNIRDALDDELGDYR